jgi:hypothetical protein
MKMLKHIVIGSFAFGLLGVGLSLASPARSTDSASGVPNGTLTYKIVFIGQATTRSAEKNAADANVLHLPMRTISSTETVHRVVEESIRLQGSSWQSDPLADEAQQKELDEEQATSSARSEKRSEGLEKAMRACKSGGTVNMSCMQRVLLSHSAALEQDSDQVEASIKRFNLWRSAAPCRLKLRIADKADGVIFAGSAGGQTGELYHLTDNGSKGVDCAPKPDDGSGFVVLSADTVKHDYSVKFRAFDVELKATKAYEVTDKVPGEDIQRNRGKTTIRYTVHVPAIVIRRLRYPGTGKVLSGSKHIKAMMTVPGAMGVSFIKFPKEGGAPVRANLPLDAVVTWTFTPDKR